jgi:hypothetical protein
MRRIILSFLSSLAVLLFSHPINDCRKKIVGHINGCFLFLYKFVWNISHKEDRWDIIINVHTFRVNYSFRITSSRCIFVVCVRIISTLKSKVNLNFLDIFPKNIYIENIMEFCTIGVELFHADGQTDMAKQRVAFRNFANAFKNFLKYLILPNISSVVCKPW